MDEETKTAPEATPENTGDVDTPKEETNEQETALPATGDNA